MATFRLEAPLVSVRWLADHLEHPQLVVLDASLLPAATAAAGGQKSSSGPSVTSAIPGSQVFDFDKKICDQSSTLPHMMPSPELFEREVRALGVCSDSVIVVYDRIGVYASPRAWWMFKAMGHDQVAVLDGGLPAWIEAGFPCEPLGGPEPTRRGDFVAKPRPELFCDADQVEAALGDTHFVVLDARSEGRFFGREPEPRRGLRVGHMPGAQNVPFGAVEEQGRMRATPELRAIFASRVDSSQRLICTCGSGVTACILALAAELSGHRQIAVYDGSWCEWGQPSSRPVVTT